MSLDTAQAMAWCEFLSLDVRGGSRGFTSCSEISSSVIEQRTGGSTMALFRRRKSTKNSSPLLDSEQPTQSRQTIESSLHEEASPCESLLPSAAVQDLPPQEMPAEEAHGEERGGEVTPRTGPSLPPEGLLDETLIGRTIKLAQAEDWEHDIVPTLDLELQILYENQRGYPPSNTSPPSWQLRS